MRPILIGFGEADRGKAGCVKWRMVATTAKAVLAVDDFCSEALEIALCNIGDGAGKRSTWRIGIEACGASASCGSGCLAGGIAA